MASSQSQLKITSFLALFPTGTSHPELAQLIARRLGLPLGNSSIGVLPSGELSYASLLPHTSQSLSAFHSTPQIKLTSPRSPRRVTFHESVREADVYIVATASSDETGTNGALMECVFSLLPPDRLASQHLVTDAALQRRLCIMAHTLRIASARRITAVVYVSRSFPRLGDCEGGWPRLVKEGRSRADLPLSTGPTSLTLARTRKTSRVRLSQPSSSPICSSGEPGLIMSS
jgi:hypothetical protein